MPYVPSALPILLLLSVDGAATPRWPVVVMKENETMEQSIDDLRMALGDEDVSKRRTAAEELAKRGEDARDAAGELAVAASDADEEVLEWATSALESLGPPRPEDQNALAKLLSNGSADSAYWAATLLGRLGAAAAPSVEALSAAMESRSEVHVKERVRWALGRIQK